MGDNYQSDVETPIKLKIKAMHLPKATDVALQSNCFTKMFTQSMPFWRDNATSMNFIGIRTMLGMVANKYFDNPFISFNEYSDFNADPVSYTHLTLPTNTSQCRSRWSPYH